MSTPPDYGEPWRATDSAIMHAIDRNDEAALFPVRNMVRAITCVNALAGVQDPAAHLANLNKELAELREWKRQQLEVENQWDCQKIGKMLGVPLGANIREHIAPKIANLNATIERWETELSAAMPPDFKDWFQNDKSEWPMVARQAIESLREREDFAMKAIEQQAETLKVMNDALKEAHRIFGNLSHSQVVQRLCPDFAEVAELVRKSYDQHA